MRFFSFLSFLLIVNSIHSQKALYVEYEQTINAVRVANSFKTKSILLVDGNLSSYTVFFNKKVFENIPKVSEDENDDMTFQVFNIFDSGNSTTYIINKENNIAKQSILNKGKATIIIDDNLDYNWQLLDEKKEINNFSCNKATLNFRGRNFIAWYTTDIPVSSGPRKYVGLPGLILEMYDEEKLFIWEATKVEFPIKLDKPIEDFSLENYEVLTLKEYIFSQEKRRNVDEKIRMSKLPKGSKLIERKEVRVGIEQVYEWEAKEEEADKN